MALNKGIFHSNNTNKALQLVCFQSYTLFCEINFAGNIETTIKIGKMLINSEFLLIQRIFQEFFYIQKHYFKCM